MFNILKFLLSVLFLFSIQNSFSDEKVSSELSTFSPLADKSLLLQSDRYNSKLVVVGERGHILYTNSTTTWLQAVVETKLTLTNIFMINEKTAWAVGHDAVILKTIDGAKTWKKIFSDINAEAPLLDLYFKDELNGMAVGAYSLIYTTKDGGLNWGKVELNISDDRDIDETNSISEIGEIYDLHLNDIAYAGEKRFYIAAEAGHILRSDDDGKSWFNLKSPYQGSFFGVLPLSFDDVLAYGLRGHLYRSSDAGNSWIKVETASNKMLTDAVKLSNGDIVIVGLAGTLLLSKDNGRSFSKIDLQHRYGLSAILETKDGLILLTGEAGVQLLEQNVLTIEN